MKKHITQTQKLYENGLQHLWLPYTQMLNHQKPLFAKKTQGTQIFLEDGTSLIDGVASWWAACHGYNPPYIVDAIKAQVETMPHIMFGGFVHEPALKLAQRLSGWLGHGLNRVFFTESGSVSVEVAMKMAVQRQLNKQKLKRTKILYFYGSYHGDTFATMSVCDPEEGMHHLFKNALIEHVIAPLPTNAENRQICKNIIEQHQDELAAIIVEPLVQGAGGMLFFPEHTLQFLRQMADIYQLTLIFDEIFTGFWRTGSAFAFQKAGVVPDIITLSKALTGGTLPLAATIATESVFNDFLSTNEEHALMHGPTFMGNPTACAAANASLHIFENKDMSSILTQMSQDIEAALSPCRAFKKVKDVRTLGAIGVVELYPPVDKPALKKQFIQMGAWIRPFRNIIYLTPAFIMSKEDIAFLGRVIYQTLKEPM